MNIRKFVFLCILSVLFAGCGLSFHIEKGYMGIKSGYSFLNQAEKEKIVFLTDKDTLPQYLDTAKFYAIISQHLLDYMSQFDTCLIYLWTPSCHADVCMSPLVYDKYCKEHHYQLIMIPESYCYLSEAQQICLPRNIPLFCVNSFYYKTDFLDHYIRKFKKSLFGADYKKFKKEIWHRLWLYSDGHFINAESSIVEDISSENKNIFR